MLILLSLQAAFALDPIVPGRAIGPVRQIGEGFTSSFLLEVGDGRVVLFDAGLSPSGAALLDALDRLGLGPEAVTDIFLTHGHTDHVGGLRAFPAATLYAHADEAPELAGLGVRIDREVVDGEVYLFGPHRVEVFHQPGHTSGHTAYLVGPTLILGDSSVIDRGALEPIPAFFSDDPAQNLETLVDLATRLAPRADEVRFVAPAHSGAARASALLRWAE